MEYKSIRRINIIIAVIQALMFILCMSWLVSKKDLDGPWDVNLDSIILSLAAFSIVTCAFHSGYAADKPQYRKIVDGGRNVWRWVEYCITATTMIWTISVSCGVRTRGRRILVSILGFVCMCCGLMSDTNESRSKIWTTLGWIMLCIAFVIIFMDFPREVPGFVWAILICMTLLFCSFGMIHLVHMHHGKENEQFNRKMEVVYSIDSLVSKTLLVLLLFFGLVTRSNQKNITN